MTTLDPSAGFALASQRHLFDIPDEVAFLNCAYISPLPKVYAYQVARIWQKWLSRRDRGSRLHWRRFTASSSAALCQRLELSIGTPPRARLSHEEPEAGNLHIRV